MQVHLGVLFKEVGMGLMKSIKIKILDNMPGVRQEVRFLRKHGVIRDFDWDWVSTKFNLKTDPKNQEGGSDDNSTS